MLLLRDSADEPVRAADAEQEAAFLGRWRAQVATRNHVRQPERRGLPCLLACTRAGFPRV